MKQATSSGKASNKQRSIYSQPIVSMSRRGMASYKQRRRDRQVKLCRSQAGVSLSSRGIGEIEASRRNSDGSSTVRSIVAAVALTTTAIVVTVAEVIAMVVAVIANV